MLKQALRLVFGLVACDMMEYNSVFVMTIGIMGAWGSTKVYLLNDSGG